MANALMQINKTGLQTKTMLASAAGTLKQNAAALGGVAPGQSRGGVQFVSFNGNTGQLTFGRDQKAIPFDQVFALPVDGMRHGWCFWENKKPEDETRATVSAFLPFPSKPDDRPETGGYPDKKKERDGWSKVYQFRVVGIEGGLLDGIDFVWEQSSKGFSDMWADLAMAISENYEITGGESDFLHPVVTFGERHYEHKVYDRTVYTPIFNLLGWTDGETVNRIEAPVTADAGAEDDFLG